MVLPHFATWTVFCPALGLRVPLCAVGRAGDREIVLRSPVPGSLRRAFLFPLPAHGQAADTQTHPEGGRPRRCFRQQVYLATLD